MIIHAPAKVNLFLELHGRRTTGFHDLETIMAPVSWYDTLRFSPSEGEAIKLRVHQPIAKLRHEVIPTDGSNLVVKAVEALRLHLGVEHGLSIDLVKRIPSQAGLGGGSSDAAAALLGAARCWGVEVSQAALMEIAGELGSDIPFFLGDGWSRCVGRGERIEALGIKQCLWVVIAKPPVGLATGQVLLAQRFRRSQLQVLSWYVPRSEWTWRHWALQCSTD